jgi:threonine/homoserine/homoserine lactone efflux protein
MPEVGTVLAFIAAVLVMQVTPGPDMMLIVGRGVGQGRQVALCTMLGMNPLGHAALAERTSAWGALREGAINNLTNPKPLMFMFAFLPQFVDPAQGAVWMQLLVLGALQKLCGVAVLGSAAVASGAIGGWLARRPGVLAWQERFTGIVMVVLGVRLLLAGDARPTRG